MIDLEELERLAKAATPGPWTLEKNHTAYDAWGESVFSTEQTHNLDNNAAYITAACNAVPGLIARVRELEWQRRYLATNAALGCHDHSAVLHRRDCWDCPFDGKACYTINLEDWLNAAEQAAKETKNDKSKQIGRTA